MQYAAITRRLKDLGGDKWAVHNAARDRIDRGEDIIELTIGEPDIPTDPGLIEICADSMRRGRTRYSNGRGEAGLIKALQRTYASRLPEIGPENILCFPGTQTALFAVMLALVEEGDGVLIGDPYYATYDGVVEATGAKVQAVPLKMEHGFVPQPHDLQTAIRPNSRVLLLNTPHNPSGSVINRESMRAIGDIALAHDLWIVCDEVYESLIFEGEFCSPLEFAPLRERTVVVSSISKSHAATGFRSGWAIGPKEAMRLLLPISETMLFGNQPFIADMTEAALTDNYDTSERLRTSLARRARTCQATFEAAEGLSCFLPRGGMFMLVDVSATGLGGEAFAWRLLEEEAVAVMPGNSFGGQAGHLIRLGLTVPDPKLAEAVRRIAALSARLCAAKLPAKAQA
ncbi:pyridoxal phosphate-dependent aminotransferase [Roseinatronobacter alkalisoli]|uniref:aspartate transaminase n=1 Tax=Roseinatronobacter alkalisoli TaxID=3028235 RepID=A0ABT5TFY8_9RHOB|nr:pyridoxal phosphate-dependent aminotransferase [Roseinatronobacter sp. HJB301]MDD7972828.1 pyridoxal phosphate-dependent aminotransferase [Roseinatronobacter sp. HJB301]